MPRLVDSRSCHRLDPMPSVGAAILCRMSSSRLPGKTLMRVNGKPLIEYIVERLEHCALQTRMCIATSLDPSDDPVARYAADRGLSFIRGPLHNVAGRFAQAIHEMRCDAVFRVNGDSPFVPIDLFPEAWSLMQDPACDLVTNIFPRTFPQGMSLELIRSTSYVRACEAISSEADREHVTHYFYSNCAHFKIHNLRAEKDLSADSFAIDTPRDLAVFRTLVQGMDRPHWSYSVSELIALRAAIAAGAYEDEA